MTMMTAGEMWPTPQPHWHRRREVPRDMRMLVTGDRNWRQQFPLVQWMVWGAAWDASWHKAASTGWVEVVHGDARGADSCASEAAAVVDAMSASSRNVKINERKFPAMWDEYGKAAGPIRNRQMLEEAPPQVVLAFHNNLMESKGTLDMVRQAVKAKIPVYNIRRITVPDEFDKYGYVDLDDKQKVRDRLEQIIAQTAKSP